MTAQKPAQPLSPQERAVFDHMVNDALTAKETGRVLQLSHRTVEFYARRIRKKFGVNNLRKLMINVRN